MGPPDYPLRTARLTLRPYRADDLSAVYDIQSRPEVTRMMLRLGFGNYGLHRIVGRIDARNAPAARLLERLGMRREAHFVRSEFIKGEWADEIVYAMLEDEWRARQA